MGQSWKGALITKKLVEHFVPPASFLRCLLLMLCQELRALGVLLGGGVEGAIASLNPFAELVRAVRFHILGTTDGIEILEGEAV